MKGDQWWNMSEFKCNSLVGQQFTTLRISCWPNRDPRRWAVHVGWGPVGGRLSWHLCTSPEQGYVGWRCRGTSVSTLTGLQKLLQTSAVLRDFTTLGLSEFSTFLMSCLVARLKDVTFWPNKSGLTKKQGMTKTHFRKTTYLLHI